MSKICSQLVAIFLIISLAFSGCMPMQLETKELVQSVFLSSKTPVPYTRLKEFSATTKGAWAFFGAITVSKPDLSGVINEEIERQNGNAIINLTIKTQTTFTDGLIGTLALLGLIYQPRTVFVSGTVVSFDQQESPKPAESTLLKVQYESGLAIYQTTDIVNEKTEFHF